jgi:hypothetical protein
VSPWQKQDVSVIVWSEGLSLDFGESQGVAIASVSAQIMHSNAPRRSMSFLSSLDIRFSFCWLNKKRTDGAAIYSRSFI